MQIKKYPAMQAGHQIKLYQSNLKRKFNRAGQVVEHLNQHFQSTNLTRGTSNDT